tara:strand:- start:33 stop:737 length:705 start_codon:yes stop_codon:yes gene_type:complete
MIYGDLIESSSTVYDDRIVVKDFDPVHNLKKLPSGRLIKINVNKSEYLQFLFNMFTRMSADAGTHFDLETLHINTMEKVNKNIVFSYFIKSINQCCNFSNGNTSVAEIREWIRIHFFEHDTIDLMLHDFDAVTNADYVVNFNDFYKGDLNKICKEILELCNIKFKNENIQHLVDTFRTQVPYIEDLWDNPNIITQAYLDAKLKNKYFLKDIDLLEDYFKNEEEFYNYYERKNNV